MLAYPSFKENKQDNKTPFGHVLSFRVEWHSKIFVSKLRRRVEFQSGLQNGCVEPTAICWMQYITNQLFLGGDKPWRLIWKANRVKASLAFAECFPYNFLGLQGRTYNDVQHRGNWSSELNAVFLHCIPEMFAMEGSVSRAPTIGPILRVEPVCLLLSLVCKSFTFSGIVSFTQPTQEYRNFKCFIKTEYYQVVCQSSWAVIAQAFGSSDCVFKNVWIIGWGEGEVNTWRQNLLIVEFKCNF